MGNEEKLDEVHKRIVDQIATNMQLYGVPSTVGRLLGTIYYNKAPMTLDEMTEELGMSKTRMSQAVRELSENNLATKHYEKGVRKDKYSVEQDYYQTFISLFSSNWRRGISMNQTFHRKITHQLNEIIEDPDTDKETRKKAEEYLEESNNFLGFYEWLTRLVEFFETHEIFKHVPKPEDKES
ncbi:GbsR/MarR family transcriptional regulator [Pontibacillus marinus]|uniref:HTH-type transcriptional regulator n=1 Tax=Pontibacillus marinus BH030004 = DSM 16465 TaxID=1385511 RepID=A0A0A5I4M3_9BACI|nr:GbsR/MarR family transcriptional regulator [Pontibacillus marinus]KGX90777.1 MarR family transcriptional regulator [Pontibacillus marinus BH030004 = DSM 16465]